MISKAIDYYTYRLNENRAAATRLSRQIHLLGTVRLVLVVGLVAALWILSGQRWEILVGVVAGFGVPFVALMALHNKLSTQREYAQQLAELCSAELSGLNYDFSAFDGGAQMAQAGHSFSHDLDIFGDRSIFQSLNRTVTHEGGTLLADWFNRPLGDKQAIVERQLAVKELSQMTSLRQHFYVVGRLSRGEKGDSGVAQTIVNQTVQFGNSKLWKTVVWVVPCVWAVVGVAYFAGAIGGVVPTVLFLTSVVVANCKVKQINKLSGSAGRLERVMSGYSRLMKTIEDQPFESPEMERIRSGLVSENMTASQSVKQLSHNLGALDQRSNMFMAILNIFIMWDIRSAINLESWKNKNRHHISRWFGALAEFDAMASLAGFAYNHPQYPYPQIADNYFTMSGKRLGHPLINRQVCVPNDISIDRSPSFMIVTGANMAGKSTYLRTVGVNFVLACVGAPVCARELTIFPASLVTSLRTSDSLTDNESYFFAELKRLKMIIDRLQSGEKLFIILDEILKGTNSVDKQKGSLALVRQLVLCNASGIIATHDLVLGTMIEQFPDNIQNFRFEADIEQDQLRFSYTLQSGIAQNMNAYFLMQKMGITL